MVNLNNKLVLFLLITVFIIIKCLKNKYEKFNNIITDVVSVGRDDNCPSGYTAHNDKVNYKYKICYRQQPRGDGVVDFSTATDCNQNNGYINEPIKSRSSYIGCFANSKTNPNNIDMTSTSYYNNEGINTIFKTKEECKNTTQTAGESHYAMGAIVPDYIVDNNIRLTQNTNISNRKAFLQNITK